MKSDPKTPKLMKLILYQDDFDNDVRQSHVNGQTWADISFQDFDSGEEDNYGL